MTPVVTRGVRLIVLTTIVLAVVFVAYKVSYTDVPPQRLAVAEMAGLASDARIAISEAFADKDSIDDRIADLTPPPRAAVENSKGPFVWELASDGTLRGRSERYQVGIEVATPDKGRTWTCRVTPVEHAPRAGFCAVAR